MKIDVSKHQILPNTRELLTKKFQSLIDQSPSNSVFYFPKGEYVLSTIHLRDNMSIYLAKGGKDIRF